MQTPLPRIGAPPLDQLNEAQQALVEKTVRALGAPVGPRMVLLHQVALATRWAALGETLKAASFSARVRELVILLVARHWRAPFEWHAHAQAALREGIAAEAIEAIRTGAPPAYGNATDAAVHDYCTQLQQQHTVDDAAYQRLHGLLGTVGLVELTALVGHYTSVAMTIVAHRVPLPAGVADPFEGC